MAFLESKQTLAVADQEDDAGYRSFLSENSRGIRFVAESPSPEVPPGLKSDFGDFAKWVRHKNPDLPISSTADAPRVVLRSADVWLPLVYLAGDTSVQIFLNMAASYLYDRIKGSLKSDLPRIHMSLVYKEKSTGKTKKFEFSGDADALSKVSKRFDLNNFFDDTP